MYNGIGLTTARGSGTNGYIQTNKFFVKPRLGKVAETGKGFDAGQGTAGVTRRANRDILEHDRKRQIELKLVVLEDKLVDQGFTDEEIADRLADARRTLEAQSASDDGATPLAADKKVSDTQTHQIAARKEKQMENLRAAFGIRVSEPEEENAEENDDEPRNGHKKDTLDGIHKKEHSFLDRDSGRKRIVEENLKSEKEDKVKSAKGIKRNKKEDSRRRNRRRGDDSSDSDDSGGKSRVLKKKHRRSSDDESDDDAGKKAKALKKRGKSARDESESDSDSGSTSSDYSDSASSYSSSDSDGSARILKKKHQRTQRRSAEEKAKKNAQRHKTGKRSESDDTDFSSSDSDSKKKNSRNKVETFKTSQKRHDAASDSDLEEGLVKEKQSTRPVRRRSGDDSSSDSEMKRKNKRDAEEVKRSYKKSDRRHDSDYGSSDSETKLNIKNSRVEDERKQRASRDEEERKQLDSRRTIDRGFNDDDRRRSKLVGDEQTTRKPYLDSKPDEEKYRKPDSRIIGKSRRSGKGYRDSDGSSSDDDEKMEKPRGSRHDSDNEELDSRYARNANRQKPVEKRSDSGERDLRTSARDYDYKQNEPRKAVGESQSRDRDDTNRRVRQRSPEEDLGYPNKNAKRDSGPLWDRNYGRDDEPNRVNRRASDRDFDHRGGGDRWQMGSEEDHRGKKHGREEEEDDHNKYRGQRTRVEGRDGRDSERDRQRDYPKRSRYENDSRAGERGDDRPRHRD